VTVVDPLRPGHELRYHPGEANLRMADVVVINKVDSATPEQLAQLEGTIRDVNPGATVVRANSRVTVDEPDAVAGKRVLVVEDGPTLTHGEMKFGAGVVAARANGAAEIVDPRPWAVGTIEETFRKYDVGPVLPAMGYSDAMLEDLERTIEAADVDVVVTGTPIDLGRLLTTRHPIRRARYTLREVGRPTLADALAPLLRLLHNLTNVAAAR
jgi:predicted GTPase